MWNFRDVRSMAEKISNAVAPPPTYDDDDDEENVEEGEEEDDVSEEEVESESEGAEEIPQQSPFGLVGRLARAMDSEQNVYNESHFNEQEDADDEHMVLLPEEEEEEIDFQTHRASPVERSTSAQSADSSDRIAKVEQQHQAASFKESDTLPGDSASYRNAPVISSSFSAKLERTKENACRRKIVGRDDSIATYSSVMTPPAVDHESEHEPEPARFSLVRESGSLSPQRKHKASIGDRMGAVPPLSPRSLGSTTGGAAVILTPLKDILYAKQQKQVSGLTAASEKSVVEPDSRQLPRDPLLGSFSVAMKDYENECFEQQRNDASPIKQIMQRVPLVSEEETAVGKGLANNPPQRGPKREDSGLPPTTLLSVSSGESRASSLPSIPLDAMHEVEEEDSESENFTRPVGNQLALEAVSVPTSAEPVNQTARFESDPIPAHQNGDSKLSAMSSEEQAKKIEKLERRCKELKKQLGNAESHIIDLQQQASQIMQQDNSEHEKLMQHFQEKESRLLQAAEEEHEQILKMVRNEMDEKVTAMQRQLVEERNAFQKDREHMGVLLAEANARADKVERQVREEQSKIEKSASQIQQQQARALGMVEVKLAQTMALLDERDEKVKKQKEMIKVLESNMTEHKEGVQEVEDEMDELHSENEALHSTVESLQAECSELRKKVAKLESDSEKLVHLKVNFHFIVDSRVRTSTCSIAWRRFTFFQ